MVQLTFTAFVRELEALSNRFGIAINTTGGIVVFDPSRNRVRYEQNRCSGDLEPVVEEISKTKTAATTQFDFNAFSDDLRELSSRHGIHLVSLGALATADAEGTMYLAVWSTEPVVEER